MENTADRREQEDFKLSIAPTKLFEIDWDLVKTTKHIVTLLKSFNVIIQANQDGSLPDNLQELNKLGLIKEVKK